LIKKKEKKKMALVSKPKCVICGKLVEDISELDVPIHVECWVEKIHGMRNGGRNGSGCSGRRNRNKGEE
jgi:hypothetical protein